MKYILLYLFIICIYQQGYSQINFNSLEAVTPPSAVILGSSPTNIDRPSTPQKLETSLQNTLSSNGTITPNLNIEIIPSYYSKKTNYSITEYIRDSYYKTRFYKNHIQNDSIIERGLKADNVCHWWEQFKRSAAFSLSTSATDTSRFGTYKPGLGIAGGFRVSLLQILPKIYFDSVLEPRLTKINQKFTNFAQASYILNNILDTSRGYRPKNAQKLCDSITRYIDNSPIINNGLKKLWRAEVQLFNGPQKDISTVRSKLIDYFNKQKNIDSFYTEIGTFDSVVMNPSGFRLDFNTAAFGVIPSNSIKSSGPGSLSFWLVPAYRFYNKSHSVSIDLIGIARYTINLRKNDSTFIDSVNYFDAGLKLALSYKKFSASVEAIYRKNVRQLDPIGSVSDALTGKSTWKITGTMSYKLTDYLAIQMTFGRNFDGKSVNFDKASPGSLYYNAGFNFGLTSLSGNNNVGNGNKSK